jgi:hypothetical protein
VKYTADDAPHLALQPCPTAERDTARLAECTRRDQAALAHPAAAWIKPVSHASGRHVFDVVIVGAIGILGHGGSAFDAALMALHEGAARVDICFRRPVLPVINPHKRLEFFCHSRALP